MELVQKHKVKDYLPPQNGWFDTDKGNIYFFVKEQEWSCRDDRISNEYPDWWLGKFTNEPQQINNEALLGVEILDSNTDFKAYVGNAHESNKYFEPFSQNGNVFFCIASVFSYGKEFAQNICDALNSTIVNLRESQKDDVCKHENTEVLNGLSHCLDCGGVRDL